MVKSTRPVLASAFNVGGLAPTIACFNKAKTPLGVDFAALIKAMQYYVSYKVAPVWAAKAKLVQTTDFIKSAWAMVFLDDADAPGALAYHDLTPDGLPISKVFVKTTLDDGALVSVSASHELAEMIIDPAINLMSTGPDPTTIYAYESCDPVEESTFPISGIQMSDFVFPSYFETFHKPGSTQFDYMKLIKEPFQILNGGYQIVYKDGGWNQLYGSQDKQERFAREDRRGHRSEIRARLALP